MISLCKPQISAQNLPALSLSLSTIHAASFDDPWSQTCFEDYLKSKKHLIYCAKREDAIIGFVLISNIAGEAEILTLATVPNERSKGVATQMLDFALSDLKNQNADAVFLEVASDNQAAIALYLRAGFIKIGLRKAYYLRPDASLCDAHTLQRKL